MTRLTNPWKKWIVDNINNNVDKKKIYDIIRHYGIDSNAVDYIILNLQKPDCHRILLREYKLFDDLYLPGAIKVNTDLARIYEIPNFLDTYTCKKIIDYIRKNNTPSSKYLTNYNTQPDKEFRTSKTCILKDNIDFISDLEDKMSSYLNIERGRSEDCQGQFYEVGNQFKYHTDYFEPNTTEWVEHGEKLGQRTWTFMIYLNNVEEGGETDFPKLGYSFKSEEGKGMLWNNLKPTGQPNPNTEHCGKPVIKGEKFIITKWFRTRGCLNYPFG